MNKSVQRWDRIRFQANLEDYRPVVWPPPGPYWCSGESDDYSIVVAYVPSPYKGAELLKFWPEANNVEVMQAGVPLTFSDRFPEPAWWRAAK